MFNLYVTVNTLIIWRTGGTGNEMIQLQEVKQNKARTWKWGNSATKGVCQSGEHSNFVCLSFRFA